ncbi:MAG: peptide-methionine (S)-S-oxide reductase MsrA [Crocinitomicaceae bacterium]|nr:peptide-methionine (S)-S-oxide reductase MsrA [Crocinitomicaceae bacterium]
MKKLIFLFVVGISLASCAQSTEEDPQDSLSQDANPENLDSLQVAYFASGCFWCVETVFESVEGVEEAVSGYSGGVIKNPTYEQICTGRLKHAEAVRVYYDSSEVSYKILVDVFFNSHDPSTRDAQGPDSGPQYRSIAFYKDDGEKKVIDAKIAALRKAKTHSAITTQVTKFDVFYDAEEYHQNYERLHPGQGYIQSVSIPRLNKFKKKMPEVLKQRSHL